MKVVNKSFAIIIGFLLTGSFAYAQSTGSVDTGTINVSATVVQGTSSISIVSPTGEVSFSDQLVPTDQNSRYLSEAVTINYFAANGPWEIRVYTQNSEGRTGLINAAGSSRVLLKVTPGVENDSGVVEFGDVENNDDWSGSDQNLKFFTVLDVGTVDENQNPFFAIAASSKNENPNKNEAFQVKFGIDVAGASTGEHEAEVTFDLAIL